VRRDRDRGVRARLLREPIRADGAAVRALQHWPVDARSRRVDWHAEDHEQTMLALGLSSKREITRTRIRVRTAMAAQTREQGRYLGGQPPFGYRMADAGPHPNKADAAWGRRAHRLEPDPATAPVVRWIFSQRLAGHSAARITRALNDAGIPRFHRRPGRHRAARPRRTSGPAVPAGGAAGLRAMRAAAGISLVKRQARLAVPPRPHQRRQPGPRSPQQHLHPRRPDPAAPSRHRHPARRAGPDTRPREPRRSPADRASRRSSPDRPAPRR
jgi:hypothetical protein